MASPINRYAASVVDDGSPFVCWLRNVRWALKRPRDLKRLGPQSRIQLPLRRSNGQLIEIGDRVVMGRNCLLQPLTGYLGQHFKPRLIIGDDCYVGSDCQFHCVDRIELGHGCVLSDQVYLSDVSHGMDPLAGLIMDQAVFSKGPVVIGAGSFVGFGAVVLAGVTLGRHCVVGARSVVTRSFPDYTMVGGNPAKPIARYDQATRQWRRISAEPLP